LARAQSPSAPSNLLPERPLAPINGRPVLEWIIDRLKDSGRLDNIVLAVGDREQDREIVRLAERMGLTVYAGHPDGVMARLLMTLKEEKADHVVRVNGNFPLVDVDSMDRLIEDHTARGADFSLNSHYHGIIYGLGVEIFSKSCLEKLWTADLSPEQLSLGSLYFYHHPKKYNIWFKPSPKTAPHLRVSVDYEPDRMVVSNILEHVPQPDNQRIIEFLNSRPDLTALQEISVPAEVSLEKVLLFPEKVRALRRNNCITYDHTYPISVELSLTNRCNHECIWCSDADLRRRLGGEMTGEILFPLFEDLKAGGTKGIVIEGGGEPTLHKDFQAVVRKADRLGLALGLITNGYRLPDLSMTHAFEWIRISLDASTREQYHQLKGVDGFHRVINNLMTLAASKTATTLGVGYVVTNRNDDLAALEQLVLFLRKIGANYIHFRPVVDHPELVSQARIDFLKKYETTDFSVNISAMHDNTETGNAGLPCMAHSLSTVITAEGSVFLCGRLNLYESWEPVGNLHHQTFHQIWTSEKRRQQVSMVSQAEFCRNHCPQCRMTKYNRLLYDIEKVRTRNFI
jgi:radical SAM protein with 4Fe4S-binding SPASM domain